MSEGLDVQRYKPNTSANFVASLQAERAPLPDRLDPAPPEGIKPEVLKISLEQVNKRLDGQLAAKTATEARAVALVGFCTTLLTAVAGATLIEGTATQPRKVLLAAGAAAMICLFGAILCAFLAIKPRITTLPGRLPSDVWADVTDVTLNEEQFIAILLGSLQRPMVKNENGQRRRAIALRCALMAAVAVAPFALVAALGTWAFSY